MSGARRNLLQGIVENAAWDLVKQLLTPLLGIIAASSLGGFLAKILSSSIEELRPASLWLSILLISGVPFLALILRRKFSRRVAVFDPIEPDFHVLRKDIQVRFDSRTAGSYTRALNLRALKNHLDRYHDKYFWTGSATVAAQSIIPDHTFVPGRRKNIWHLYEIHFDRRLRKKDEIKTTIKWDLADPDKRMVPFVSAVIEEPTDELRIVLEIPASIRGSSAVLEVAHSIGARKPIDSQVKDFDEQGRVEFPVPNPKLLHVYEVSWSWHDSGDPSTPSSKP